MAATAVTRLNKVLKHVSAARASELVAAGIPRTQIARLMAAGKLQKIGRGLYASPDYLGTEHSPLLAVAKRAPRTVFCLLTALRFHELTTQSPADVWIAIGNKEHPPRLDYPPLRTVRFSETSLRPGVDVTVVDGVPLRVTSPAKTVADCFKFRNKVGLDVAIEALRDAWRERRFTLDTLDRYSAICRVQRVMQPYIEALTA